MTKRLILLIVLLAGVGAGAIFAVALPSLSGPEGPFAGGREPTAVAGTSASERPRVTPAPAPVPTSAVAQLASRAVAAVTRHSYREVTIPTGTALRLGLDTTVATDTAQVEDAVRAHLVAPVVVQGLTVIPAESDVTGHVTAARRPGKVHGRAYLAIRFTELRTVPDDEEYRMTTRVWAREGPGTKKKDAATIGVPAGVGAVVGGIVGGKKGAGVGAAVGGGAGTGVVLATRGKDVRLQRGAP